MDYINDELIERELESLQAYMDRHAYELGSVVGVGTTSERVLKALEELVRLKRDERSRSNRVRDNA